MTRAIRCLLTALLLIVVWRHSHWSVALTLTGLCIANELNAWLLDEVAGRTR
jgi:hypothetical protein